MFSIHNNKNKEKPKIQCFFTSHWRVEFLSLNYTCLETFEIHLQIPTPLINGDMKIEKLKMKFGYSTCYHYTTFLWSQDNLQRKNIEEKLDIFMKIHKWLDSLEKLKFSFCKLNSHINNVSSELINGIF